MITRDLGSVNECERESGGQRDARRRTGEAAAQPGHRAAVRADNCCGEGSLPEDRSASVIHAINASSFVRRQGMK